METNTFLQIRINSDLKEKFQSLAESKGLTASSYIIRLINEELEKDCMQINGYSDVANAAAYAVADNGMSILLRPKFAKVITKTVIQDLGNGLCKYCYLDNFNKLVLQNFGKSDDVLTVGEVIFKKFEITI